MNVKELCEAHKRIAFEETKRAREEMLLVCDAFKMKLISLDELVVKATAIQNEMSDTIQDRMAEYMRTEEC